MAFEWLFGTQSSAVQANTLENLLSQFTTPMLNMVRTYPNIFFVGFVIAGSGFFLYRKLKPTRQEQHHHLIRQQSRAILDMGKKMLEFEKKFTDYKTQLDQQSEGIAKIIQWQNVNFLGLSDSLHDIKKSMSGIKGEPPKLKPSASAYKKT